MGHHFILLMVLVTCWIFNSYSVPSGSVISENEVEVSTSPSIPQLSEEKV